MPLYLFGARSQLWLIDQDMDLYSISLSKQNASPAPNNQAGSNNQPKFLDPSALCPPSTTHLKGEPAPCRRVFYKLTVQNKIEDLQP